jgi:hypothetical protein
MSRLQDNAANVSIILMRVMLFGRVRTEVSKIAVQPVAACLSKCMEN